MYTTNYLKEVILRVDFSNPIVDIENCKQSLKDAFKTENISYSEKQKNKISFDLGKQSFNVEMIGIEATYQYPDSGRKLILENEYYTLIEYKYTSFDSMRPIFLKGLDALNAVSKVTDFKRIGLRYINAFPFKWEENILKKFILIDRFPDIKEGNFDLRRGMSQFVISNGEYTINYNYGIWNNKFPQKVISSEFILDIDCFVADLIMDASDISKRMQKLRELCGESFEQFITDKLREKIK